MTTAKPASIVYTNIYFSFLEIRFNGFVKKNPV